MHFNKQLIKTSYKAFWRSFGEAEAWFIKTGQGKQSVFKFILAKSLIREERSFLLYENDIKIKEY